MRITVIIIVSILFSSCAPTSMQMVNNPTSYCLLMPRWYSQAKTSSNDISEVYQHMLNSGLASKFISESQYKVRSEKITGSDSKPGMVALYKELSECSTELNPNYTANQVLGVGLNQDSYKLINEFMARIHEKYIPEERKLFLSRTRGKKYCESSDLTNFLANPTAKPSASCLYNSSGNLTAFQVTPEGILVHSNYYPMGEGIIFLRKTSRENIVDGARIDPGPFEYTGIYQYVTLFGVKSVYSFKRYTNANLFKDIYFYNGR